MTAMRALKTSILTLRAARAARAPGRARRTTAARASWGETNDKVITNAGFILIAFFPLFVLVAEPDPVEAGEAQGRPQEGREGARGARRRARRLVARNFLRRPGIGRASCAGSPGLCWSASPSPRRAPSVPQAGTDHVYTVRRRRRRSTATRPGPARAVARPRRRHELHAGRLADRPAIDGGKAIANGAGARPHVHEPAGTTIADFSDRPPRSTSTQPAARRTTRPLYALYRLGRRRVRGRRRLRQRRRATGCARSTPGTAIRRTTRTSRARSTTLRQMGALAGYRGDAPTLMIRVGCSGAPRTARRPPAAASTTCCTGSTSRSTTRSRPARPSPAEGLLAGGPRHGSDPVVVSATDNAGIRRRRADRRHRHPGASSARSTPAAARGSRSRARTSAAPRSRRRRCRSGARSVVVRTIDVGRQRHRPRPVPVDVATPSDRGARQRRGRDRAGDADGALPKGGGARARALRSSCASRAGSSNASGQPIAGARLELRTTNEQPGAGAVLRKTVTTDADGDVRLHDARDGASRTLTLGWKSHLNDGVHAAADEAVLRDARRGRAARLDAPPAARAAARRCAAGCASPRAASTVILQGRRPGARALHHVRRHRRTRRHGRFAVGYRFRERRARAGSGSRSARSSSPQALPVRDRRLAPRAPCACADAARR